MSSGIKCRKCGGNHLTIKCDKNKQIDKPNEGGSEKTNDNPSEKGNKLFEKRSYPMQDRHKDQKIEKREYKPGGKVKMSSLPSDITKEELQELLYDWGNVKYINIKNYQDDTVAYIEFKDEEQADYLIKALDNTPFEFRLLKICRID